MIHAFDVIGDPVRRRILEALSDGERQAGDLADLVVAEFGISRPAVSQHLRVLREAAFVHVRVDGSRRLYTLDPTPLQAVDLWLDRFRDSWSPRLEALATEVARGKRKRRKAGEG